jgi:2-C-methyl-D-erythritol 2,4-cyclodiphosphate synthase
MTQPQHQEPQLRIGLGHDTHRLVPGGPLRLGGIDIPHDQHLDGHSDADALLHAITDALLGAIAAGDIGELFSDQAAENYRRDSADFLRAALKLVDQRGWSIVNLDCIIHAQKPKLSAFKPTIAQRIAELLELPVDVVSIKAKTGEGVGVVGTQQAIQTQAIVLLQRTRHPV